MARPYSYQFDGSRLSPLMDPDKTPLILVACGSFSPLTFLHLRMFEMARDHAHFHTGFAVLGGYLSPVNDLYSKPGLACARDRINMCQLAVQDGTSEWLSVDDWEASQPEYTPTALVLDHFDYEINERRGGVDCYLGVDEETGLDQWGKRRARIMLLAGSDLILTMSEPGVWAEKDLHHILGLYGCYIIERAESELDQSIFSSSAVHSRSPLALYRHNIFMVDQLVRNDVSSTKVRMFLRKGMSVRYLIPGVVVKYIEREGLYRGDAASERRTRSGPAAPTPNFDSSNASSLDLGHDVSEKQKKKENEEEQNKAAVKTNHLTVTSASRPTPRSPGDATDYANSPFSFPSSESSPGRPSPFTPVSAIPTGRPNDRKGKGKANPIEASIMTSSSTPPMARQNTSTPSGQASISEEKTSEDGDGASALSPSSLSHEEEESIEPEQGSEDNVREKEEGNEPPDQTAEQARQEDPPSNPLPRSPYNGSSNSSLRLQEKPPMSPSALLNASRKERLPTGGRSESESRLNSWLF